MNAEDGSQQGDGRSTLEEDRTTQRPHRQCSPERRAPSRVSWNGEIGVVEERAGNGWMAETSQAT